jgi:hypothetical protein
MADRSSITAEFVRSRLHYDSATGIFTWLRRSGQTREDKIFNTMFAGKAAGWKSRQGNKSRIEISFGHNGSNFKAHRLAWLYVHGAWPSCDVDHINGDPTDNRIENLRLCTASQNARNRGPQVNNTSGFKGVWYNRQCGKYSADIWVNGKKVYLGLFPTKEAAAATYALANDKYHGEFGRLA